MPERLPTFELLRDVIRAAEEGGFESILLPTGQRNNHFGPSAPYLDSIVAASMLASVSQRVNLLLAIRTGLINPATTARICASLDVLSGGRLMVNVVTGGSALKMIGDDLGHDDRYRRTEEEIAIWKGLWANEGFSFSGKYHSLIDAVCYPKLLRGSCPPMYFAGESEIAREIGVRHADCMLMLGTGLSAATQYAKDIQRRSLEVGRTVRAGIHFYVIARETKAKAFEAAERLVSKVDPRLSTRRTGNASAATLSGTTSCEMIEANLWEGFARALGQGWSVAILGSYSQVAETLKQYVSAGFSTFILSAFPLAGEAARLGAEVLPLVTA